MLGCVFRCQTVRRHFGPERCCRHVLVTFGAPAATTFPVATVGDRGYSRSTAGADRGHARPRRFDCRAGSANPISVGVAGLVEPDRRVAPSRASGPSWSDARPRLHHGGGGRGARRRIRVQRHYPRQRSGSIAKVRLPAKKIPRVPGASGTRGFVVRPTKAGLERGRGDHRARDLDVPCTAFSERRGAGRWSVRSGMGLGTPVSLQRGARLLPPEAAGLSGLVGAFGVRRHWGNTCVWVPGLDGTSRPATRTRF